MSKQSERYIQLHRELWEAFCFRSGYSNSLPIDAAQGFVMWLTIHKGIYQPACREYLDILGGMKA